jgi:hypothetical protein
MCDNVIILGAGASVDAGIPMLSNFVQVMWEIALRGSIEGNKLTDSDMEIFKNAVKVRDELDQYHGRARFDDRNIEDILSILTFNLYEKKKIDQNRMDWIIKAIERTIELSCKVNFDETKNAIQNNGDVVYRDFWCALLKWYNIENKFPTIISFNYDLVLERALFQIFNNYSYASEDIFKSKVININYYYKYNPSLSYKIVQQEYYGDFGQRNNIGTRLIQNDEETNNGIDIDILKLHGSLNFNSLAGLENHSTVVSEKPLILPPVFNKNTSVGMEPIWKRALECLRKTKNVIFVGYSLPQTDIYIQYFLKAGLGPNNNLNKIFVYNPCLQINNESSEKMKERYCDCFSPQIYNRIVFSNRAYGRTEPGSFQDFVETLLKVPNRILF